MKSHNPRLIATGAIAAFALAFGSVAVAQTTASDQNVRIASKQDLKCTVGHITGKKLMSRDGKSLGSIKDLLIDPHSGRIQYAVLSSGGFAGIGNKLHLIPYYMLRQHGQDHNFQASITPDQLKNAPSIGEDAFDRYSVAVDSQQQSAIDQAYGSSRANVANAQSSQNGSGTFIRASKLEDRDVMANGTKFAHLENLVIDPGATHALALVKPAKSANAGDHKFLVPLQRLHLSTSKKSEITTTLDPSAFQNAAGTASTATVSSDNNALAPTGLTSAEQNPAANQSAISAAQSIRQALDADPSLAHANVQVTPQNDRVLVHGSVQSKKQRDAIEHAADNAASNASIDFNLTVHNQ